MREKLLGNGHSELDGSGSAGSGAVAAAGTPVGNPGMPDTLSASRRAALAADAIGAVAAITTAVTASNRNTRQAAPTATPPGALAIVRSFPIPCPSPSALYLFESVPYARSSAGLNSTATGPRDGSRVGDNRSTAAGDRRNPISGRAERCESRSSQNRNFWAVGEGNSARKRVSPYLNRPPPGGSVTDFQRRSDDPTFTRRSFLRYGGSAGALLAGISGGGLWRTALAAANRGRGPDSLPDPTRPAGTATAALPFDHIVVVMMENHSFDNLLGALSRSGQPKAQGLKFNPPASRSTATPDRAAPCARSPFRPPRKRPR